MADQWQDVAAHPQGGFVSVRSEAGKSVIELDKQFLFQTEVPTDWLRFTRIAVSPIGEVRAVGIGADDNVYLVKKEGHSIVGRSAFQNGCAITHDGNTFVIYCQTSPTTYTKNGVEHPMRHSSQGFQDVFPDGRIVFGDETVVSKSFNGNRLWRYVERGDYVVGDADNSIGVFRKSDQAFFIVKHGPVQHGINAAVQGDRLIVVAMIEGGKAFYEEYPPFPAQNEEPKPEPKPEEPKPEEPEVPNVEIPDLHEVVDRVNEEHPHLLAENSRATATEFLWRAAEALAKEDPGFGLLTKDPSAGENHTLILGKAYSTDALAYKKNGIVSDEVVDIIINAGGGTAEGHGPAWGLDERKETNHWAKVPPFPTSQPKPEEPKPEEPKPEEPGEEPIEEPDYEGFLELIIARVVAEVKKSVDKAVLEVRLDLADLREELEGLTFEGKHRLLGTITFKRKIEEDKK